MNKGQKEQLQRKLVGYTVAAGAALAVGQDADATARGNTGANIAVSPGQVFDLEMNDDGVNDFRLKLNLQRTNSTTGIGNVAGTTTYPRTNDMATIRRYMYSASPSCGLSSAWQAGAPPQRRNLRGSCGGSRQNRWPSIGR